LFISRGRTRGRTIPGPPVSVIWKLLNSAGVVTSIPTNLKASTGGTQITESDGNRWPPPQGGTFIDCGSEFYSQKKEVIKPIDRFAHTFVRFNAIPAKSHPRATLEGNFLLANAFGPSAKQFADTQNPKLLKLSFPPDISSSRSQLEVKGQIAVAACAPSNQIANAARSVGELLRDVPALPGVSLWKSRLRAAEVLVAGSSEFLNGIFGVLPTISDVTQFYTAVHKIDKTVDQFIRDSGKLVRRSYYFPKEITETLDDVSIQNVTYCMSPIGSTPEYNNLYAEQSFCLPVYKTMRRRVTEREIWFSGGFTYHLPDWYETGSRNDRKRLTAKLLGAEPDLTTLWQLAPWSWAVDWVVNAGTWIKSLQALISYGTVMRYGYVMEKTTVTDTFFAGDKVRGVSPGYEPGFTSRPFPAVSAITLRTTTKKRIQANPFGFGISWDGLSTTQRAIVTALGITRVVR